MDRQDAHRLQYLTDRNMGHEMNASAKSTWSSVRHCCLALPFTLLFHVKCDAEWLTRIITHDGAGKIVLADDPVQYLLGFGHTPIPHTTISAQAAKTFPLN
jgi:hypothetical protein